MSDKDHQNYVIYMKCKVKNLAKQIDVLRKKASAEHLGLQDDINLKRAIAEQTKFTKRLKQEKYNGKTKIE